ncbi:MAG: hypothetical protein H6828_16320 [Planctomycetes bacterium]|nr:hypothetical protein [Planctomycetota bacterium]
MAIFLLGLSRCPICEEVHETSEGVELLPAVAWGESDPLWELSDAAVHASCLAPDPRQPLLARVLEAFERNRLLAPPRCLACGGEIDDPRDYIGLPWLTHDEADPLAAYSFRLIHASHVRTWKDYDAFMELLRRRVDEEPAFGWVVKTMERARGAGR